LMPSPTTYSTSFRAHQRTDYKGLRALLVAGPSGIGMGGGRPLLIRRATWLTLESGQSFLEALDDVILDADALRQLTCWSLCWSFSSKASNRFATSAYASHSARSALGCRGSYRSGVWSWPRVRGTLALGLRTRRRRVACAALLFELNARIWAHDGHLVGVTPRAAARGWQPTPILSRNANPMLFSALRNLWTRPVWEKVNHNPVPSAGLLPFIAAAVLQRRIHTPISACSSQQSMATHASNSQRSQDESSFPLLRC
jgi:hypothetical protein